MIEVRNLVHRYNGTGGSSKSGQESTADRDDATETKPRPAVDGVSLTIDDGSFVVLAGPNGSGKTTLVRQFNGLLDPDAGTVSVNGQPVTTDVVAARTAVAMTFQDPRDGFVAATIGADVAFGPENLGLDRNEIDRRVADALAAVRLDDRENERIDRLSGGERARVAIAGALAMAPDHLVLDEPFAGLDEPARQSVLDRIRALHADGTGIVVVTHDLRDLVDPADRVLVMNEGRVALDAPPAAAIGRLPDLGVRAPC
ncbi:energy-coupling factor ABC transporter ATP-binding protein [Halococcus saccharolyticus]|uniref:Putative cobalt ABC transporter ATP-binding protein n=1 Tax=Halococcus saccharolyticus DSM 5350 TaxID=1227455 RepID=M0MDQ1_9EURY|nr:ABC transporter ATP-binding protein [Halococcus saccharolyticus]EMA43876.1 putative cobalt ABC transporter ATP-binding protein [Halococcus saccharolyticus DSM 5350]